MDKTLLRLTLAAGTVLAAAHAPPVLAQQAGSSAVQAERPEGANPSWPSRPVAAAGAPNIVLVLLDDVGFGAPATFGGPAATPELDRLAAGGLRYNQFHTTALCSPTRASLLTGRNHHQTGFGNLQDVAAGYPGYDTAWHKDTVSIPRILHDNGYSTAAFGKWHNTPIWEISPAGPFDRWPTGLGFDYFYGFLYGESSQWEPRLYRNTTPVEPPSTPAQGYHLTPDLVNDALHWVHQHDAAAPEKPFFLYFATGATHAPHHVPKEWIAKYKGQFDQGWDKLREETFARQKRLGVIPANAELTPRPDGLPAWSSLSPDQKRLYARQMEVYAAFLSQTDAEIGRLLDGLKDAGKADNTLVLYVVGDNGGSAEGGLEGSDENFAKLTGQKVDLSNQLAHIDDLGSPLYDNHYAVGWSWATTTPFQWMKQIASHFGGTRDGFVVSWPGHTSQPGVVRNQFSHVNDIAPTIYAAAKIQFPDSVDGVKQLPLEGKPLLETFTDPEAKTGHDEQYFEMFGNRAIYKDGWVAGARRYEPWDIFTQFEKLFNRDFAHDKWELYHVSEDFSEAHDLAASDPKKLEELKAEFDSEARRNNVYPLVPIPLLGAPSNVKGKTHFVYDGDVDRLPLAIVPDLTGRAHRLVAEIDVPQGGGEGVIVAEGGRYGGFSLYVKDGRLTYENNTFGDTHETIVDTAPLPAGPVQIAFEFTPDAPAVAARIALVKTAGPGQGRLLVNGQEVGSTRFTRFGGFQSSINETFDLGHDTGSPVSTAYEAPFRFSGTVKRVTIDLPQGDTSAKQL